jgi:hypothetical protein
MHLPEPRGVLSETLVHHLQRAPHPISVPPLPDNADLCDEDLHLALAISYELHNGGIDEVEDQWEWDPSLLGLRQKLEIRFERALARAVPRRVIKTDAASALRDLVAADPSPSLSRWMVERGTPEQFRELIVHRSFYQLREADPHTWAIPRLRGSAKAAMVMVQADEYGNGIAERMHSSLFARTMKAFELDATEGSYVDWLPGPTLASVNLMHLFGLHRRWRGAIAGHLAVFEMTSTAPNSRYADALRRFGYGPDATEFYDEHVEADEVHQRIACEQLAGTLAREDPAMASDIMFGGETLLYLDGLVARHLIDAWERGVSSLRKPVAGVVSAA